MKTTTLVNPETQVNLETPGRIQQLKLGVDWHADHFRVVRMCDGQSPQPAQRFTPANFLRFVQKQLTLADRVFVVYEAGPGGFPLSTTSGVTPCGSARIGAGAGAFSLRSHMEARPVAQKAFKSGTSNQIKKRK